MPPMRSSLHAVAAGVAVAAVAAANIDKKRIMLQVGPGMGKSRIWATLVFMLRSKFTKFRVLFTDHVL